MKIHGHTRNYTAENILKDILKELRENNKLLKSMTIETYRDKECKFQIGDLVEFKSLYNRDTCVYQIRNIRVTEFGFQVSTDKNPNWIHEGLYELFDLNKVRDEG